MRDFQKHPKIAYAPFYALKTNKTKIHYLFSKGSRLISTRFTAIEILKHQKHQNSWQVAQIKDFLQGQVMQVQKWPEMTEFWLK